MKTHIILQKQLFCIFLCVLEAVKRTFSAIQRPHAYNVFSNVLEDSPKLSVKNHNIALFERLDDNGLRPIGLLCFCDVGSI